jgi:CheY-like chemotaxis protein
MLKVSNRDTRHSDAEERFALHLFNGLVQPGRPINTFRMGRSEFVPVVLLLVLPAAFFVLGIRTPSGDQVNRWINGFTRAFKRSAVSSPRPGVLVVTANATHQFDVTAIVEPRGYAAYCERTTKQGMDRLRTAPGQFKLVVVDGAIPGSSAMVRTIKQAWPDKPVIVVRGPRQPASLARSLLNLL